MNYDEHNIIAQSFDIKARYEWEYFPCLAEKKDLPDSQAACNKQNRAVSLSSGPPVVTTFQSEQWKNEGKNTWENCDVLAVCGQQDSQMFIYLCRKFHEEKWDKQPDLTSVDDFAVWSAAFTCACGRYRLHLV